MTNRMEVPTGVYNADAYNAAVLEYDGPHFGLTEAQVAALDAIDREFMGPTPYVFVERTAGAAALLASGDDTILEKVSMLR